MPRGRYQQQQWETREQIILDALTELAAEHGFAAVTMDDLAEAVGISKATLYQHFASKDALLAHLMREHTRQFQVWLDDRASEPPLDRLRDTMRYLTRGHTTPRHSLIQIRREEMLPIFETDAELIAAHAHVLDCLSAIIRRGQAAGEITSDLTPDAIISAMWALSNVSQNRYGSSSAGSGAVDDTAADQTSSMTEQMIALFMRGIRPLSQDRS